MANNYTDDIYDKIINYLPKKSIIILLYHKFINNETKNSISKKFIILENIVSPHYISYGPYMDQKEKIIKLYKNFFEYVDSNFDNLDINNMCNILSIKHICNDKLS